MNKKVFAIFCAILAAALYAINIPLSKVLLKNISPIMMASLLYLGAGIGIGLLSILNKTKKQDEKYTKKDAPMCWV